MLGTSVKTFCDHGVKIGVKVQQSKWWCRLRPFMPIVLFYAGSVMSGPKETLSAEKDAQCRGL